MEISSVSDKNVFTGSIIIKNQISKAQKHLFELHKPAIEKKIKDLPFDLFVEQSKSKKSISLTAGVNDANSFAVLKNKQNFEEMADFAIADGMKKSEVYKKMMIIDEMVNYNKLFLANIAFGKFKEARAVEKTLAKLGVENFAEYKEIPKVSVKNVPWDVWKASLVNGIKYRIYRAFSKKTPEEKSFLRMKKEYFQELKSQKKQLKTVQIDFIRPDEY